MCWEVPLREIREFERSFKFPIKQVIKCGYFYFDYLLSNSSHVVKKKDQVLFAPSWNYKKRNLFDDFGLKIIDIILEQNYKIIFRPHPEILKRSKKKFNEIIKKFKNKKIFQLILVNAPKNHWKNQKY